ncbi:Acyl CoA binding protein [Popillia japonica]|uniref:Acyl CoA binding protein n=1 Tax=Popillia japonica TaxID=7064 RepID=A0AAW1HTP7_POPJA
MYLSMDEKFQTACQQVRNFTKRPPDSDMLELYSLFKQATIGNINIAKPTDAKGKVKWDAWNTRTGMSQVEAKKNYIELARNFASKYE